MMKQRAAQPGLICECRPIEVVIVGNFIGTLRLKLHPPKQPAAGTADKAVISPRTLVLPLAMAQFLASYDTQAMTVAISQIVDDLGTTVIGVQTAMSIFTLTM